MKKTACKSCNCDIFYPRRKPVLCKACRLENKLEKMRIQYGLNKETNKRSSREYYHKNKDRILKNKKIRNIKNREKYLTYSRKYYQNNKLKRAKQLRAGVFGITVEQYDDLLSEQQCKCPICKKELDNPCIDHDHSTGKVRGILCNSCNLGIGWLKEDIEILKASIRYLETHK